MEVDRKAGSYNMCLFKICLATTNTQKILMLQSLLESFLFLFNTQTSDIPV